MKLLIGSSAQPDHGAGVHSYVKELCACLLSQGHELTLLSRPPRSMSWAPPAGVRSIVHEFDSDPLQAARQVAAVMDAGDFDGVINNDNPILQSLSGVSRCAFISVGHLGRTSMGALACHNHAWVDHVVAISTDMKRAYTSRYGVPAEKVRVIFNGVADTQPPRREQSVRQVLRLIYAGGYLRYKGADLLASALDAGDWAGVELHWYGVLPHRVRRRLGKLAHVTLHGAVPRHEFMQALADADCVVLPSREEGCPMVMLEAMCLGVVPIVSDGIGAMKEIVASGSNGLVCSLRDWRWRLREHVRDLAERPDLLAQLKRGARETYARSHTMEKTAAQLLDLLQMPSVDRCRRPVQVRVLDWHRPMPGARALQISRRVRTRFGLLRHAGWIIPPHTLGVRS